jgi:hypothetical protein
MLVNGKEILNAILFDIRMPLNMFKGAAQAVLQNQDAIPTDTLIWFQKWEPVISTWILEEAKLRAYCWEPQDTEPDWEQLIADLGSMLEAATDAHVEAQTLQLPENPEAQLLVEMAIRDMKRLSEMQRVIQSQEYKRYWMDREQSQEAATAYSVRRPTRRGADRRSCANQASGLTLGAWVDGRLTPRAVGQQLTLRPTDTLCLGRWPVLSLDYTKMTK